MCNALLSHTPHPPPFRGFALPWRRYGLINGIVFIGLYHLSFPSLLSLSLSLSLWLGVCIIGGEMAKTEALFPPLPFKKREREREREEQLLL